MADKKITQLDEAAAATPDDLLVIVDDPSGTPVTKKATLSAIAAAITGDVTFSGIQIIGSGEDSGDGYGKGTLELVPDLTLAANDQYIIVDPTAPNHIHLRAGGDQDGSNAELILGGEHANVRVVDSGHQVHVASQNNATVTLNIDPYSAFLTGYVPAQFRYGTGSASGVVVGSKVTFEGVEYTVTAVDFYVADGEEHITLNSEDAFATLRTQIPDGAGGFVPFDPPFPAFFEEPRTFVLQTVQNNWTFGNDGVLDLAGGLRFPDNSVQTTAGMPLTGASWGDVTNYSATGSVAFDLPDDNGQTKLTVRRFSGDGFSSGESTIVLAAEYVDNSGDPDAKVILSISGGSGMGNAGSLTISAQSGITFRDGSTQGTAGVVSVDPDFLGSFVKVSNIVKISQADYDAISTPDANTVYLIVG